MRAGLASNIMLENIWFLLCIPTFTPKGKQPSMATKHAEAVHPRNLHAFYS
jgi:hypothetical protein